MTKICKNAATKFKADLILEKDWNTKLCDPPLYFSKILYQLQVFDTVIK